MKNTFKFAHRIRLTSGVMLLSASYMTLGMLAQVRKHTRNRRARRRCLRSQ
ncbi:MAG: hypothetical protein WDN50_15335 [Bradyrhizobium sp.]